MTPKTPSMRKGVLLRINIQSLSDVITNSSSEIFCQIQSNRYQTLEAIRDYLNSVLPSNIDISTDDSDEDAEVNTIDFWCEQGAFYDYDYIPGAFAALLRETLNKHFTEGIDYTIKTDVDY